MKINTVEIHNFRSIMHAKFNMYNYGVILGANNAGKTNIITALRIFYEDNRIKYNKDTDAPKFGNLNDESWIEIEYHLDKDEFSKLDEQYRGPNNTLKLRRYLVHEKKVKPGQSNIYGYVYSNNKKGQVSDTLFYNAKNISQAKIGSVIYIPELVKAEETLKLTGPSPLRNILTFVVKKFINRSKSYKSLEEAFNEFNERFKDERLKDEFSLSSFEKEVNKNLKEWSVEFDVNINPIDPENIIKNLISYNFIDNIINKKMDTYLYGQGLQRHLIYTLIRLSSKYKDEKIRVKKTSFSPDFTLILFEEPEAFLHPNQQEILNMSFENLSKEDNQQVLITTHSPIFVSKNIENVTNLIRLNKDDNGVTKVFQLSDDSKKNILLENDSLVKFFEKKSKDNNISENIRDEIKQKYLNPEDIEERIEKESMRYVLWLDSERSSAFFAELVLICEGATEKTFIEYLIKNEWSELLKNKIYVLDAMGKPNIHRYMNLFKELGIYHSVLFDEDSNNSVFALLNDFIRQQKNEYTIKIDSFKDNIESFFGVDPLPRNKKYKKPLYLLWKYRNNEIDEDKLRDFKEKIFDLINS